jgi:hypothetical protein
MDRPFPDPKHEWLDQGVEGEKVEVQPTAAAALPTPESVEEWKHLPAHPPGTPVAKVMFLCVYSDAKC